MPTNRFDETWHRLLAWTQSQAASERLAAQILLSEGFESIDPSHPLGGRDGGKDALCSKGGEDWVMAAYFPRGQQTYTSIKRKFEEDLAGARKYPGRGIAFVTNQELTLSERENLKSVALGTRVELYHLERITIVLDRPMMASVRKQFLAIDFESGASVSLGGAGGAAPGAGGGGGGALGTGAQGGDGGAGGKISIAGMSAQAPGAGGGGAGAEGDGAIGGEGGGGGEIVSATFDAAQLPDSIEIVIGRAGRPTGGDGEDGGETTFGDLLKAKGGKGGRAARPGASNVQWTVSSATLANYAEVRDGLMWAFGCGWDRFHVDAIPAVMAGYFAFVVETDSITVGGRSELLVELFDPQEELKWTHTCSVHVTTLDQITRVPLAMAFAIPVLTLGRWIFRISCGTAVLAAVKFILDRRASPPDSEANTRE